MNTTIPFRLSVCLVLLSCAGIAALLSATNENSRAQPANKSPTALPFTVPPGFVVDRIAGPPLVEHPMMANFDDRGRLFIAEAAGKNLRKKDLLKSPPNFIRILESRDAKGRFRKSRIFADQMTFPMGVLSYRGSVYSAAPPSLWKLQDNDGDGAADVRRELVTKFGFTGNAASIHGPFLGPDGWIYWTDGRHGHEIKRPDGSLMKGKAARIFRCRPDGSDVEVVCGGGMDDPVEIAFTAEGEPFVTVDILHNRPSRNDGIIFAIEGGVYPWHTVWQEFKQTGDLLPAMADLGWVAPSGLVRYRSDALGKPYQGNLFSAQFNRHRIQRHIVKRKGASFEVKTEDFLTSTNPHFHPTDVLEDADGSLLIVDTGGWFRIGCPTSQTARPEFKGGIYRVRRKDAKPVADPHGLKIAWNKSTPHRLVSLLDDPRFLVRDRAVDSLARLEQKALPALKSAAMNPSTRIRRNAVWSLARMKNAEACAVVRQFLKDKDISVRLAAARAVGLNRDGQAAPQLLDLVKNDHPALKRQAATAIGRLKDKSAIAHLLAAMDSSGDRFLDHALIYALIQIGNREQTVRGLQAPHPSIRRGALIALDQMSGGNLTRELVVPLVDTTDEALQQTALNIISSRKEWSGDVLGLLRKWLGQPNLSESRTKTLANVLLRMNSDAGVQKLVAEGLRQPKTPMPQRLLLLETISRSGSPKLPAVWKKPLMDHLHHRDKVLVRQTIAAVRSNGWSDLDADLLKLAKSKEQPLEIRLPALAVAAGRLKQLEPAVFSFVNRKLTSETAPLLRLAGAQALASVPLSKLQLLALAPKISTATALELPHLLSAYERSSDTDVGRKLMSALEKSNLLATIPPERLDKILQNYNAEVLHLAGALKEKLKANSVDSKSRLDELEQRLAGGDPRIGRSVFFGSRAACYTCHVVKGQGGKFGPDLTKIGAMRSRRDLLESVVFPSTSFVRGYEPYSVVTKKGKVHAGILGRETAKAVFLVQTDRSEMHISRSEIVSISPSQASIMPQGLDRQLSPAEFRDLIAYLQSLK